MSANIFCYWFLHLPNICDYHGISIEIKHTHTNTQSENGTVDFDKNKHMESNINKWDRNKSAQNWNQYEYTYASDIRVLCYNFFYIHSIVLYLNRKHNRPTGWELKAKEILKEYYS